MSSHITKLECEILGKESSWSKEICPACGRLLRSCETRGKQARAQEKIFYLRLASFLLGTSTERVHMTRNQLLRIT